MSIVKKRLAIEGMSCVHCQEKIERTLKNTAGIESAEVRCAQGRADVAYDPEVITLERIREIVGELDYRVLPEGATGFGRRIALLAVIALLYILLQELGVLNLLVPSQLADTEMGYGMLFVIGLMTSVHCVAMCGGINLSQCIPRGTDGQARPGRSALRPALLYNLGRVLSYTAIGFLLGLVGRLIGGGSGAGIPVMLQGVLKLAAGALMVVMGVNMLGLFPPLRRLTLRLPGRLALRVGERRSREGRPLFVGLLNGLMPCGPLQSMQIVALASASPWAGALSMLLFSLGTVPLMLGLGSLVSALGRRFSRGVMAVGAVLVVVLGLAMLSQGGSLSGLLLPDRLMAIVVALCVLGAVASLPFPGRLYRSLGLLAAVAVLCGGFVLCGRLADGAEPGAAAQTVQQDGVQVVNSTLSSGRYPDITVQAGIPVRWVIDAPAGTINGCNYKMLVSAYGIEHVFTEGENVIEFTSQEAGTVPYTCWMGMIRGNIFVTDGSGSSSGQPSTEGAYGA